MSLREKLTDEVLVNAVNTFNMYERPSAQGREAMRTVLLAALEGEETPKCSTCRFFDFSERDTDGKGCCENGKVLSMFMMSDDEPFDFNVPPTFGCADHEAAPRRESE